jgi:NAD-dependent oxidoreductase involved in siderophore biosynthesis
VGSAFNALVAGLDAGQAYLNVHTASFPGGEIRGLLVPVPEPETYALMLAGLGIVGWAAKRRQRA